MRILAVDFGRKRIGLAVTDPDQIIISSLAALAFNTKSFWPEFEGVLGQYQPGTIVIGMPAAASTEAPTLKREIEQFAAHIKKISEAAIVFVDESYTSHEAEEHLRKLHANKTSKKKNKQKKERIDSLAAHLILRRYLDQLAGPSSS